jgi:hypothetical protein
VLGEVAETAPQLHVVCCEHRDTVKHIARRLNPDVHVEDSEADVTALRAHVRALIHVAASGDGGSSAVAAAGNVFRVAALTRDHVAIALAAV